MTSIATLAGKNVLIVEDDFYLADDEKSVLERAGAHVIGPFRDADQAIDRCTQERVDCAILDINLGSGPDFTLARTMQQQGIPFVFVTGYGSAAVPADLRAVERLEKPVRDQQLIALVESVCL